MGAFQSGSKWQRSVGWVRGRGGGVLKLVCVKISSSSSSSSFSSAYCAFCRRAWGAPQLRRGASSACAHSRASRSVICCRAASVANAAACTLHQSS